MTITKDKALEALDQLHARAKNDPDDGRAYESLRSYIERCAADAERGNVAYMQCHRHLGLTYERAVTITKPPIFVCPNCEDEAAARTPAAKKEG